MPKFNHINGCDDPRFNSAQHGMNILDHHGNPIARVQEFDTKTMLAVVKAADYAFYYPHGDVKARDKLLAELPPEYHDHVRELPETLPTYQL